MRIKLEDGREFPTHDGKTALSWDFYSYFTFGEEQNGFPKLRAVLSETSDQRLEKERMENLKASFNRMFGRNAKRLLQLIEEEQMRRLR